MLKNKILQEFLNSDIKIISQEKLEQYIEYCIYKNQNSRIKDEEGYSLSSHHHILPEALFDRYKDLRENEWNGTHLLYSDHYYAHWLLTESIDDYGQLNAFCAMHNKDMKLGRINESDLIPPEEFQKKMEEKGRKYSEWCKNNPEKMKELKSKLIRIRNCPIWKDTIGKESIIKMLNTKSDPLWKLTSGVKQSIKMRQAKKLFYENNESPLKGRKKSPEERKKISEYMLKWYSENESPNKGIHFTEEHKENLKWTQERKKEHSNNMKINNPMFKGETKNKVSESLKEWHKNNISEWKGKKHSNEAKEKISKRLTGLKHTIRICPHCNKEGGGPNMTRYHFDNCKENPDKSNKKSYKKKEYKTIMCPHCGKEGILSNMTRYHFDNCKTVTGIIRKNKAKEVIYEVKHDNEEFYGTMTEVIEKFNIKSTFFKMKLEDVNNDHKYISKYDNWKYSTIKKLGTRKSQNDRNL